MRTTVFLSCLLFVSCAVFEDAAGTDGPPPGFKSIHQLQTEYFAVQGVPDVPAAPAAKAVHRTRAVSGINGVVFGYYPYWMGTAYNNLDWGLLTHVTYFSAELNAAGGFDSTRGWPNGTYATGLRTLATANGAKLLVSVTAFSSTIHNAVLQNMAVRAVATSNLISLVTSGDADGIDLDFEGMASGNKTYFTAFVTNLAARLRAVRPGALVTIACPAVDWGGVIDRAALADTVDFFFIMGYDYHWSSGNPGAVSPLAGGSINLTQSVDYYNDGKIPSHKIICGLPYYGIDWPSTSGEIGAAKLANGSSVLYKDTINYGHTWDSISSTPWKAYQVDGVWHQRWFENWRSIEKKIQMLKGKGIGGMGMWALGYDGAASDLWQVINKYFNNDYAAPAGSIANPFLVTTFPYNNTTTTVGAEKAFDYYLPTSSANETGPDQIYALSIPGNGKLKVTVTDSTGVDIDIQLLTSLAADSCVIRNDSTFEYSVTPGLWYLVCDTWNLDSYAGAYTLTIEFTPAAGSHGSPYLIDSFPYSNSSTTVGKESVFSNYLPLSATQEYGPEEVYLLRVTEGGTFTMTVTDGTGIDIDIHLLTNSNAASCIARHDTNITVTLLPGEYHLVADTWSSAAYAGPYTLTVTRTAPVLLDEFETGTTGWTLTQYTACWYTGSLKCGDGALRLSGGGSAERIVDTSGRTALEWLFSLAGAGLEPGDRLLAEYNHSGTWLTAAVLDASAPAFVFKEYRINLPAEAADNPNLGLRFRMEGDDDDYGMVDRVMLSGN